VIPRKDDGAKPRPRLGVVRSELRLRESRLGREPRARLLAHPLEYDNRAIPVAQPRLTVAGRLGRLVNPADQRVDESVRTEPVPHPPPVPG
jgi:hypothetical protein